MSDDARRRRRAKQARRDARRIRAQQEEAFEEVPEETPLIDEVRHALATDHPLDLLALVGVLLEATTQDPLAFANPDAPESVNIDDLITGFIGVQIPETTALLGVLVELLDDAALATRCREELAAREDAPPEWVTRLPEVEIRRVTRMTHVLGEGDEVVIGARLADGAELTCAVHVDHTWSSQVSDAFILPVSIDEMVAVAQEHNTDPDTTFVEMDPADARAWVEYGIEQAEKIMVLKRSDTWPACRPLLRWLLHHMPEGGQRYQPPRLSGGQAAELFDEFFSGHATKFADQDHRELLEDIAFDTGTGDPLRWSAGRIEEVLNRPTDTDSGVSTQCLLDLPDLLRAFVPFAHARSGIRDELTAEALAVLDEPSP
ncbi:hypothetical protein [Mycolicibacterium confluentis]|uniref:Uncharacterized protein n=1 Tax=Mycolicibacterium confluentis TaxID=28047 RepID=A0A7I7XZE4_9MYCO|nr:hypothetical protein [Mycolicibacterium confluentis]MCV7319719.1 hypothetical protein [Mycolicibacterium confluentis]BBZ34745.1 hypothetical protein MCNF_33500 [Mycolicibacterium confluentis]